MFSRFSFSLTDAYMIVQIINKLKPKSSAGHDDISTIILKKIAHIIAPILSITLNQSLCTRILPNKLKIAKVIPLFKTMHMFLTTIAPSLNSQQFQNYLKKSCISNYMIILKKISLSMTASMVFVKVTQPN